MIQKGRKVDEAVPVVMMTHDAVERDVRKALDEINRMDCVSGATVVIRVEEGTTGINGECGMRNERRRPQV